MSLSSEWTRKRLPKAGLRSRRAGRMPSVGDRMTTVLLVDDHPIVARYTKREIEAIREGACVRVVGSLSQAEQDIGLRGAPDYVLLDLILPDCDGLFGLVRIKKLAPLAIIGIVTGETNPEVMRDCFLNGARGYLMKNVGAEDFSEALRKLLTNGFFYPTQASHSLSPRSLSRLTKRELDVLQALATGKANKQLAPPLRISESTLKTYLRSIYEKLGVRTRTEAVREGLDRGLIDRRRRK